MESFGAEVMAVVTSNESERELCGKKVANSSSATDLTDVMKEYEIIRNLGIGVCRGLMLCEHKLNGHRMAVKYYGIGGFVDEEGLSRQIYAMENLRHPCVVRTLGFCPLASPFKLRLCMEYACNGSLGNALGQVEFGFAPTFWTHENISNFLVSIVLGMRYVHSKGFVHPDFKPAHLVIDDRLRVRICGFGIEPFDESFVLASSMAESIYYAAPEYFDETENGPVKKPEVFAFGLILYELIVGKGAFPKNLTCRGITEIRESGYLPKIPESVNSSIREIIERCWRKDGENRPTFDEVYGLLEDASFRFFDGVESSVKKFVSDVVKEYEEINSN
jgi:serine/threonine protein kinase